MCYFCGAAARQLIVWIYGLRLIHFEEIRELRIFAMITEQLGQLVTSFATFNFSNSFNVVLKQVTITNGINNIDIYGFSVVSGKRRVGTFVTTHGPIQTCSFGDPPAPAPFRHHTGTLSPAPVPHHTGNSPPTSFPRQGSPLDMFNLDLTIHGPFTPDMFKLVQLGPRYTQTLPHPRTS